VLSYRWLEGFNVLAGPTAVASDGSAVLSLGTLGTLAIGDHALTLEVSDGSLTVASQMKLTVGNSAPTATCTGSGTYQAGVDSVVLIGDVADFDGDPVSWSWAEGTQALASGSILTSASGGAVALPTVTIATGDEPSQLGVGMHVLTLSVSDGLHAAVG